VGYEALSYTWGDATDTRTIIVNGSKHQVTRNLEAALRHLRQSDYSRKLWCDAVCINQTDNQEKSIQVQRIGDISNSASKVLIWLGKPRESMMNRMFRLTKISLKLH
jgi:hypothetical protein